MKKLFTRQDILLPLMLLLMMAVGFTKVSSAQKFELPRDVIEGYVGWAGNPDTLTIHIEDTFSDSEKDSVRVAIQRWNAAGCKPALKEVSSPPAKITVTEGNPGDGNAGVYEWETDADGKVTGGKITIRNNSIPGLVETATHELGHALGLDDVDHVANPSDVMKGNGPPNGTNGGLSQHDSTELKAAMASIIPIPNPENNKKKRASSPATAFFPGQTGNLIFDLEVFYPPSTLIMVQPVEDPLVNVNFSVHEGNTLFVSVTLLPGHGSGKFYLKIEILPPMPLPPRTILGYHFVHNTPVPPVTFNCPMEIYQDETGAVIVIWQDHHTYPFPNPLRAMLVVDGTSHYLTRNNYRLNLPTGPHLFELFVHDFQVNSAYSSADFFVESPPLLIDPGIDPYIIPCWHFSLGDLGDYPGLPLDFFDPGSDPFTGRIEFQGASSEGAQLPIPDMTISRPFGVVFSDPIPSTETIPIEIVQLNLQSVEPIKVTYGGSTTIDSFFDVFVTIESPREGTMEITRTQNFSGLFTQSLELYPVFTFVNVNNPAHIVQFEPFAAGYLPLLYNSVSDQEWQAPPIAGEFDPSPGQLLEMHSLAGETLSAAALLSRSELFSMEMDESGTVVASSGTGYNNGSWYYYPNTNWWNIWFYDHPFDADRKKIVNGTLTIEPRNPDLPSTAEIVLNWSTPQWPGFPNMPRPPLPPDVPTIPIENQLIVRSAPLFIGAVSSQTTLAINDFIIEDYNPEWLSIDVRGSNFTISGSLQHVCFKEESCPPQPQAPSGYELRVGPWLIAEPWHQWIDGRPGAVTPVQLHVHDPDNQIAQVAFEYNMADQGWIQFYVDLDGEECTASPHVICGNLADGWSGYFNAPEIYLYEHIQFRAEVLLLDGTNFYVDSFFDLYFDPTPPLAVSINIPDAHILFEDNIELLIVPEGANISTVRVVVEPKKNEFAKGIDTLSQRRSWRSGMEEGGDNHCVPTSAAACLKYFADSASDNSIMGGLTPDQLVDSLAKLARTNIGIWGTYYSQMASALRKWIKDNGDNYTVRMLSYNWKTMRNELERSQDVLQGIRWPDGSGHMMTFNSIVNKPLPNGNIRVDFMDPWSGKIEYGDLDTITGQVTNYTNDSISGRLDWTIIVCPKEPVPLKPGGQILPGPLPTPLPLNFPDQGMFWIRIEILDLDGNKHRFDRFVERVYTEQNLEGTVPPGSEICYDGTDIFKTGGDAPYMVEPGANVEIFARKSILLFDHTHLKEGSQVILGIADQACELTMESEPIEDNSQQPIEMILPDGDGRFVKIYPNPSPGLFNLEFSYTSGKPVLLEVFNIVGEKISTVDISGQSKYPLDISDRPAGLYLLRVIDETGMVVHKIIKQ